jgi:dinuclear metal center YbgI/SA1388 family protein
MVATLSEVLRVIEPLAPSHLSENWDNTGLQLGHGDWPVSTIWVALDPLPDLVSAACGKNVDLLITHHPLIFRPLGSIDFSTPVGEIIRMASESRTAVYTMHTNLDSAAGGVSDILAERIGLNNLKVLGKPLETEGYKLILFAPSGLDQPVRIERVVKKRDLEKAINRILSDGGAEAMTVDVRPLETSEKKQGLGRVGELPSPMKLFSLAEWVKERLSVQSVKVAGSSDLVVKKAAVCGGSGSGLLDDFFSSGAQVYISGDLRYHDARAAEAANLGIIDIGHFPSEHFIVDVVAERVGDVLEKEGIDATVEAYRFENDPFVTV